jgi:hypothetical protein
MKPRLKSAPETQEDWDVWLWVNALWLRRNPCGPRWPYTDADRRDADLMYVLTRVERRTTIRRGSAVVLTVISCRSAPRR